MSKSKYPNKIDTSIEIPIARDNVTQITSELINSLRSAIIQIQKTLGVKPNGDEAITVSTRLSRSLDDLGNIKKDAIAALNLLSGPIKNKDVAEKAEIEESKLNLDYSTKNLYGQNSAIKKDLDNIIKTVNDIALKLSLHLSNDTFNQHIGIQVNLEDNRTQPTSIATNTLTAASLQDVIENLYNNHINLIAGSITEINNAHNARQIYFDSSELVLSSTNVQDAIQEVSGDFGKSLKYQFDILNSNGLFKFGQTSNPFQNSDYVEIISSSIVSFSLDEKKDTTFILQVPQSANEDISKFDILKVENISEEYEKYFKINSVNLDSAGNVSSIKIFGSPEIQDNGGFFVSVLKNNYKYLNLSGLNTYTREGFGRIREPYMICVHPNSASIYSTRANANYVSSSNKNLTVLTDIGTYTIDVYNPSLLFQTIDSVIQKFNLYCVNNNVPLIATKLKRQSFFEISISHIMPNISGDSSFRYIELKSSSDDASSILGLSDMIDKRVYGSGKNSLFYNGEIIENPISVIEIEAEDIEHNIGTSTLSSLSSDFLELGIKSGDSIFIESGSNSGMFTIFDVNKNLLRFDNTSFAFSSSRTADSKYFLIKNGVSLGDFKPEYTTGNGIFFIFDTIILNNSLNAKKRVEYAITNTNIGFSIIITNVSKNFIIDKESASFSVNTSNELEFTDPLGNVSSFKIDNNGFKRIYSADNLSFIDIYVEGISTTLSSTIFCSIYGYSENSEELFLTSRSVYSYNLGFILNSDSGKGVPSVIDKRLFGTIKTKNISSEFFEKELEGPRNELRSCGVIQGCKVSNISINGNLFKFDISSGVHYVNGARKEFVGVINYYYTYISSSLNYLWICFNKDGHVDVVETNSSIYPDSFENNIIAVYDNTLATPSLKDLRIFINKLDRKVSKELLVSKDSRDGNFENIQSAIDYIKYIELASEKYSSKFSIKICSEFTITEPIKIELSSPLKIIGYGDKTRLTNGVTGQSVIATGFGIEKSTSCMFNVNSSQVVFENLSFYNPNSNLKFYCAILFSGGYSSIYKNKILGCSFVNEATISSTSMFFPVILQSVLDSNQFNSTFEISGLSIHDSSFSKCGNEYGCILIGSTNVSTSEMKNILISNNSFLNSSPNANTTFSNYNILQITDEYKSSNMLTGVTTKQISIVGNVYEE